jgi:hypothetical protein
MSNPIELSRVLNIKWGGVRSSPYGINPFPQPEEWAKAMKFMAEYFPSSTPLAVWGIGEIDFDSTNRGMKMGFPNPGGKYDDDNGRIRFSDKDEYEKYFSYFDSQGIQVFLQVEPGFADIGLLIDATFKHYGHHSSVIGFGVDVEWYQSQKDGGENASVTDELAAYWEEKVKSYNDSYKLFLKHYDKFQLPSNYRGDIIFIDDTQELSSYKEFLDEMIDFADYFGTNSVMFQIGYESDKPWWNQLPKPPQKIGQELAQRCSNPDVGVIWVDFTLKDVLPI